MPQRIDVPGMGIVEFPDGMSDDQISAAIRQNMPQQSAAPGSPMDRLSGLNLSGLVTGQNPPPSAAPSGPQVGVAEDVAKGTASGLGQGALQVLGAPGDVGSLVSRGAAAVGVPEGFRQMAGRAFSTLPQTRAFATGPTSEQIQGQVEQSTGKFYKPQTTAGKYAHTLAEFAPGAALPASRLGRVANVAVPAVASETAGLATEGTAAEPYARAGAALVAPTLMAGGQLLRRRAPDIPPRNQEAWDRLRGEGVNDVSVGEITGNLERRYRETAAGTRAQAMDQRKMEQLTEAAVRRFGETGHDFHEAVQRARPRIGAQIESAAQRMIVRHDAQFGDDLINIERELVREGLDPNQLNRIGAIRDNIVDAFSPAAVKSGKTPPADMTGTAFHNLIRTGSPLKRATEAADTTVAYYARRYQDSLMEAADRTAHRQGTRPGTGSRQAEEDFIRARREWANMRAMEESASVGGPEAAAGRLTPASLRMVATNRGKGDYARGRGDYNQLAKDANLLMTPLPNSGTAQRLKANLPARLIGALAGSLIGAPTGGLTSAIGATLGATAGPAIRGRMVRLTPWWLGRQPTNNASRIAAALLGAEPQLSRSGSE